MATDWGNSPTNNVKPLWRVLKVLGRGASPSKLANTFATSIGWMLRRANYDECIVAINHLDNKLGNASLLLLAQDPAVGNVTNGSSQTMIVLCSFNKGVQVTTTPTIVAISSLLSPANVTLTYNSTASDLTAGKVVFDNRNINLAQANAIGATFTVNSTSVASGWAGIQDPQQANNAVANGIPTGLSLTIGCS